MNTATSPGRVFLIDKEAGVSSFQALYGLKKDIGNKKVGHAGTLDPFATGLLIAMSGKMTKALDMVMECKKEYYAEIRFGEQTDTLDTEGRVIHSAPIPPIRTIEKAMKSFHGEIRQIPPHFSAIKIDGKRAYKSAREGQDVDMPERLVNIHELEICYWKEPFLGLRIRCSKGTYIRSLARDMGLVAESRAYCSGLRRTGIGPFHLDSQVSPSPNERSISMTPAEFCQAMDIPVMEIDAETAMKMKHGRPLRQFSTLKRHSVQDDVLCVDEQGREAALIRGEGYRIVF